MTTYDFCREIENEQFNIRARCEAIDGAIKALEAERKIFLARDRALATVETVYKESQQNIEEVIQVQARSIALKADVYDRAEMAM